MTNKYHKEMQMLIAISIISILFLILTILKTNTKIKKNEENVEKTSRELKTSKECKALDLKEKIGKLVIVISNEKENPMVAKGLYVDHISQSKEPMLVVENIVNGEKYMVFGMVFIYTQQKFDALNSLDPNSRIALFFGKDADYEIDKSSSQKGEIIDSDIWASKVKEAIDTDSKE